MRILRLVTILFFIILFQVATAGVGPVSKADSRSKNWKPAKAPESERDKLFWERTKKIRAANAAAKNRSQSNKNKGSDRSRLLKINSPPPAPDDQYFRPVKAPKNKQLKRIQPTKSIARTIESNDISPPKKDSNDVSPSKAKHKKISPKK